MDGNYNPYNQYTPYGPENPEPKKDHSFGKGMGWGILVGVLLAVVVFIVSTAIYTRATGNVIAFGSSSVSSVNKGQIVDKETAALIDEVGAYINLYYTGEFTMEDLRNGLLHGLVAELGDPYSQFYTPKEYEDLNISTSGTYAGVGAALARDEATGVVTVTKVYTGTPSFEVGLLRDDVIKTVDGTDVTTLESLDEVVGLIRGEEGSTVEITLHRPSTDEDLSFTIERKNITLPSVEYSMLENHTAYIIVSQFQKDTDEQFSAAIADLQSQGMEKMIIDLRDNPGGMLDTVCNMLDEILPEGLVVYTEDKYGNRQDSMSDANCLDYPMVVLINGNSASASEIFAGAIKDYKYGTLIGTTTFGKGIVQSIFNLSNGCGLKITSSKYFTPNGNNIHKIGIEPDIELEYEFLGAEDELYDITLDNQVIYAQKYLNGEIE